jgi:hypothetical protein
MRGVKDYTNCKCLKCGKDFSAPRGEVNRGGWKFCCRRCFLGRGSISNPNRKTTHALFSTWSNMLQRCYNPRNIGWKYYGEKGVAVCDRWRLSFWDFVKDMGPKSSPSHTLDRIDNNGNYEPGNCRWATRKEQARNTSRNHIVKVGDGNLTVGEAASMIGLTTSGLIHRIERASRLGTLSGKKLSMKITVNGVSRTIAEWAEVNGIKSGTIYLRMYKGWSPEQSVTMPKYGRSPL